ncbi:hypothetical protein PR048_022235 [Dryococelus australis]|uniref:Uncharacterized protein n=1 Tax=Dryococelus australis TaxID=614101 RepID=A0ABQ9H0H6_9NEOP|nr:hypothetical protein PR048_022235 [Dryococelus australis]
MCRGCVFGRVMLCWWGYVIPTLGTQKSAPKEIIWLKQLVLGCGWHYSKQRFVRRKECFPKRESYDHPERSIPGVRKPTEAPNYTWSFFFFTFDAAKRGRDKGDTASRIMCVIASKRKDLDWRAASLVSARLKCAFFLRMSTQDARLAVPRETVYFRHSATQFKWQSGGGRESCDMDSPRSPATREAQKRCLLANHGHSVFELPNSDWPSQRHDGNTARLARRSDEALGVRVRVALIAPSLLDLDRGEGGPPTFNLKTLYETTPASSINGDGTGEIMNGAVQVQKAGALYADALRRNLLHPDWLPLIVMQRIALFRKRRSEPVHINPRCLRLRLLDVSAASFRGTARPCPFLRGRPLSGVRTSSHWRLAPRRTSLWPTSALSLVPRHTVYRLQFVALPAVLIPPSSVLLGSRERQGKHRGLRDAFGKELHMHSPGTGRKNQRKELKKGAAVRKLNGDLSSTRPRRYKICDQLTSGEYRQSLLFPVLKLKYALTFSLWLARKTRMVSDWLFHFPALSVQRDRRTCAAGTSPIFHMGSRWLSG